MLTGWLEAAKLTVKVQRQGSPSLQGALAKVQEQANAARVAALRERVAAVYGKDPASAAKYAWPRKWTLLNGLRIAGLDLDYRGVPFGPMLLGSAAWQVEHCVPRAASHLCMISWTCSPVRFLGRTWRLVGAGCS